MLEIRQMLCLSAFHISSSALLRLAALAALLVSPTATPLADDNVVLLRSLSQCVGSLVASEARADALAGKLFEAENTARRLPVTSGECRSADRSASSFAARKACGTSAASAAPGADDAVGESTLKPTAAVELGSTTAVLSGGNIMFRAIAAPRASLSITGSTFSSAMRSASSIPKAAPPLPRSGAGKSALTASASF